MSIESILGLLGGLGLFLFGMKYMGDGLELATGPKMKDLLEKLTNNRFMGFMLGVVVTLAIQSSSATTVMAMGFVNASIMTLAQATGVIFGANIGTTITSILIAADVSGIAPICICAGALMMLYSHKPRTRYIGQVALGFGLLFSGLHTMSSSLAVLRGYQPFLDFIATANNPFLGFIIGVILCAVLQSSSAAVGVIQALAMQGIMPLHFAAFIVCGINVGSSTPVMLAAIGAKNNAKRAAIIYLLFNAIGTVIFVPLTMLLPVTALIEQFIAEGAFQIAAYHILFKVVTGILLLPTTDWVVRITYKFVPKQEHESELRLVYIDPKIDRAASVIPLQVKKEIQRMSGYAKDNYMDAMNALIHDQEADDARMNDREGVVDYLAYAITDFITDVNIRQVPQYVAQSLSRAFQVINELEQIGDHALKIYRQSVYLTEQKQKFSDAARVELEQIYQMVANMLDEVMQRYMTAEVTIACWHDLKNRERTISMLANEAQKNHMARMHSDDCAYERSQAFMETLNSLERIANHASNIVESFIDAEKLVVGR